MVLAPEAFLGRSDGAGRFLEEFIGWSSSIFDLGLVWREKRWVVYLPGIITLTVPGHNPPPGSET